MPFLEKISILTKPAIRPPNPVTYIYKLGYVKDGSTAFKVQKDGCGVLSTARALLGPEGF